MHLKDFQKEILNLILKEKINDINSFIKSLCKYEKVDELKEENDGGEIEKIVYIIRPDNEKDMILQLKLFIILWDKLEKAALIKVFKKDVSRVELSVFSDEMNSTSNSIHLIINDYLGYSFLPLPDIEEFVKRNFITDGEYHKIREIEDREKALKLTRRIAYFTIIVSIVIFIGSVVFNYVYNMNDRIEKNIYLIDTLKINKIPLNNEKDTLK